MEDLKSVVNSFNPNVSLKGSSGFTDQDIFAYQDREGNLVLDLDTPDNHCMKEELKCYICGDPAFRISAKKNAVCLVHCETDSVECD